MTSKSLQFVNIDLSFVVKSYNSLELRNSFETILNKAIGICEFQNVKWICFLLRQEDKKRTVFFDDGNTEDNFFSHFFFRKRKYEI
jgi:hypothetical protein